MYYARVDENNVVIGAAVSENEIDHPEMHPVTEDQYLKIQPGWIYRDGEFFVE